MKKVILTLLLTTLAQALIVFGASTPRAEAARSIVFPVVGASSYSNDYYAPRGNQIHHATDIIAKKGQPLVAVVSGTIVDVQYPQPGWGYSVTIRDDDGYEYLYIHMNDDTPGTNDSQGGGMRAYAVDVREGNRVVRGQLLGWVGDSGRSNGVPHLHFEMFLPNGQVANPYNTLEAAQKLSRPVSPYPRLPNEILPYKYFSGGAHIAYGNLDLDGGQEFVTGARVGGRPYLNVFEPGNIAPSSVINPFPLTFLGGIDVATGDVDGDGVDEIIAGAGPGGLPSVRVFERDGTLISAFNAYAESFRGGVHVSTGDVDNDGVDEIITGPGSGGGPHVTVRKVHQPPTSSFMAYSTDFRGGIDVSGGDIDGDGIDEIVVGLGPGGAPRVRALSVSGSQKMSFLAYEGAFKGGVRISAGNVRVSTLADEILTVPAGKGGPHIRMFNNVGAVLSERYFLEEWWRGANFDIGAGQGESKATAGGNRRSTIRAGLN